MGHRYSVVFYECVLVALVRCGVVIMIQSDQVFKGLPTFIHFRSYKWVKKLTREDA